MKTTNKQSPGVLILVLTILGIAVSLYLTYLYYSKEGASFCVTGTGCDTVRDSQYSKILGFPVALLGVIGYSLILITALTSISNRTKWLLLYLMSLIGVAFSVYLTYLELFLIHAVCFYCVISAILITIIFILVALKKSALAPGMSTGKMVGLSIVVIAITISGAIAFQPSGVETESSSVQVAVAKHLGEIGATMYGSYQCPHCSMQKLLFGERVFYRYIKYVECDPSGENANPQLCQEKGITNYPTWEINGQYYVGTKSLRELSKISGLSLPSSTPK